MEKLDLATYGVEEMNEVQMNEVDGCGIIDTMMDLTVKSIGYGLAYASLALTTDSAMVKYHDVLR